MRFAAEGMPAGRGHDDVAVGQLVVTEADTEPLDQGLMQAAITLIVRRMRRPAWIRHRVINIGLADWPVTSRPPTRQIAA